MTLANLIRWAQEASQAERPPYRLVEREFSADGAPEWSHAFLRYVSQDVCKGVPRVEEEDCHHLQMRPWDSECFQCHGQGKYAIKRERAAAPFRCALRLLHNDSHSGVCSYGWDGRPCWALSIFVLRACGWSVSQAAEQLGIEDPFAFYLRALRKAKVRYEAVSVARTPVRRFQGLSESQSIALYERTENRCAS